MNSNSLASLLHAFFHELDYQRASANVTSRYGMGGVRVAAVASRASMLARSNRRLKR